MSEEKNKEPTEKRLQDAREKGEVAKSLDLTGAVCLFGSVILILVTQNLLQNHFVSIVRALFDFVPGQHELIDLINVVQKMGVAALTIICMFAAISLLSAIAALFPQVGFAVSTTPITPNLDVCNPASGFKRIFSVKSLGELIRSLIKTVLIGIVMYKTITLVLPLVTQAMSQPLLVILQVSWSVLIKVLLIATVMFCLIGLIDYSFQKWIFMRQHRMSETEIKQEYKEMEGDPHIKSERKKLAREIAFSPSLKKAIATANVMVVNPEHYAVAIRYVAEENRLPHVVAKGCNKTAAKMRRIARQTGVPIVANPKVARSLYPVPEQKGIPPELFEIVAVILTWVEEVGIKRTDEHA